MPRTVACRLPHPHAIAFGMSTFGLVGRAAGVFVACAAANWFFGGTSDDSRDDPKPPRYSPPTHSPPPSYGSFPGSTADDKTRDASQVAALQAQVQAGNNLIRALETKLGTLSIAMKRAEADAEQVKRLRAEARVNDHLIASLESKVVSHAWRGDAKLTSCSWMYCETKRAQRTLSSQMRRQGRVSYQRRLRRPMRMPHDWALCGRMRAAAMPSFSPWTRR